MYVLLMCMYIVYTCMYMFKLPFARYLSLFGDHVVPAVLYSYTQVLLSEELVNTKGKPLVTTACLESVWKRTNRVQTVGRLLYNCRGRHLNNHPVP